MQHPLQDRLREYPKMIGPEFVTEEQPPLTLCHAVLLLLIAGDRKCIKTPLTGDASLYLTYKDHGISVLSYKTSVEPDLSIVQFQGAKSRKSYRGNKAIDVAKLFAEHSIFLAQQTATIQRITMPDVLQIEGITEVENDTWEAVQNKYQRLRNLLRMVWTQEECQFVVDKKMIE